MKFIKYSRVEQHIAWLVVDRPQVRNALHWEAMEEFTQVISGLQQESDVRVLLVSGAGKAFISGI